MSHDSKVLHNPHRLTDTQGITDTIENVLNGTPMDTGSYALNTLLSALYVSQVIS